jgi:hypothetical protein
MTREPKDSLNQGIEGGEKRVPTLYKLKQIEDGLLVVPSKMLSKLRGCSACMFPDNATNPVPMIMRSTKILRIPRKFWRRRPQLSAVPCRRVAKVMQMKPTKRRVHRSGSILAALRMYSPNTREFPAAQP